MRIAILSPYPTFPFQSELGCLRMSHQNNATWTVVLARHLAQLPDTEIHVVTQSDEIAKSKTISAENITIHFIKSPRRLKTLTLWQFDRRRIHRVLDEINPDVVHGQGIENQYGYSAVTYRKPHLITLHGITRLWNRVTKSGRFSRAKLAEKMEQHCLRKARNLVVINPLVVDVYRLDQQSYRLFPIPNAVADEFFAPATTQREPDLVVSIGTLEYLKGFDVLLQAAAKLQQRGCAPRINIIGQSPGGDTAYRTQLEQFARDHALKINFTGFLSPTAVAEQLRRCAVLVHASRHENAPMAIAESMATGATVLASDVGGVRHMIDAGKNGFLFRSENDTELADKLERLMTDVALRQQLGRAAATSARQTYHPQRIASLTRQAYEAILK